MIMFAESAPMQGVASVFKNPTIDKLRDLKLKVMAQMMNDPDSDLQELGFEERFGMMVEKEWLARKNSRIKRLLSSAALGINAFVEDIDYSIERSIDKKLIQKLATCTFIEQKLNIVVSGKTGSGKTYIACAIGNVAGRHDYSTRYFRIPELLLEIQAAKSENQYSKFMRNLQKIKLLILDDIGRKSYTLEESRDILEIVESRYNKSSTILAGQIAHTKWYELFPDPTIADAIMDRVIHNAYILAMDSKRSMREVMAEKIVGAS